MHKRSFFPKHRSLSLACAMAAGTTLPTLTYAQDDDAMRDEKVLREEVVVTGSRLNRTGFDTPTPVTVIGEEEINAEAAPSIDAFVATLPSVQGSGNSSTSSGSLSAGGAGVADINLRALGSNRTLVLLDGQRNVTSRSTGQVDVNTMPQGLIKSVEVVTGGASAAYGSDAVGGVINFILDRDFTGFKTRADYSETSRGDAPNGRFGFTGGLDFADGRGHFIFDTEIFRSEGVHYESRDWNLDGYQAVNNPRAGEPGQPRFLVTNEVGIQAYAPGGIINLVNGNGPGNDPTGLVGTYFGLGGQPNQLAYGEVTGQWMIGGDWDQLLDSMRGTNSLAAEDNRDSYFGRVDFNVTQNITAFAQASYARYDGYSFYIRPTQQFNIAVDNAFLPESVRQQMIDNGVDSVRVRNAHADVPASGTVNERETFRYVVGAEGAFSAFGLEFDWDTYWQTGITETDERQQPTYKQANFRAAIDSIVDPDTGEIVCRDPESVSAGFTEDGPNFADLPCVPFNPLGVGVATQEGLDYVLGTPNRQQEIQQDVFAFNFRTNSIDGWAGPIALAFGGEWRNEQIDGDIDGCFGGPGGGCWKYGNYLATVGEYDVTEFYFEAGVPVFDGFDLNAAYRRTDYSTSGGVNTWKVGLTYSPIEDVTFRYTQSRDIRAPNLAELFDPGTGRTNNVPNPNAPGGSDEFLQQLTGSTEVGPEEADSFNIGVILQPRFAPGLSLSIDYYDIEIDGVIAALGAETVAENCFEQGIEDFCRRIEFASPNDRSDITLINLFRENLNSLTTQGIDLEASYTFDVASVFGGVPGTVTLRGLATHYIELVTDDGTNQFDLAGVHSAFSSGVPDWSYRITAMYALNDFTANATIRGLSDGVVRNEYIECQPGSCPESIAPNFTINDNSVAGAAYLDLYFAKTFGFGNSSTELFAQVRNLFDEDPEMVAFPRSQGSENRAGYLPTSRRFYDVLGRTFRLGARIVF
ncbi:MAG: TonB-dependent receptor [Pseudomonadota bacterium]